MTDRLKVSLFDTLVPFGIGGARVLDLYAGSGSLGIEMLSRGAEWCDFVELRGDVVRVIEDNLRTTGLSEATHVYKMEVKAFLSWRDRAASAGNTQVDSTANYDIILLDPPYADPAINNTLELIANSRLLAGDAIIVIGHAIQVPLEDEYGGGTLRRVRHKVMGGSTFSIYERAQAQD